MILPIQFGVFGFQDYTHLQDMNKIIPALAVRKKLTGEFKSLIETNMLLQILDLILSLLWTIF